MRSITKNLEWSGEYSSKKKGESLFEKDEVTPLRLDKNTILLKVNSHKVSLEWHNSSLGELELVCSCTCSYYTDHMEPCLHVWASLRRIEDPMDPMDEFIESIDSDEEIYLATHNEEFSHYSVERYQETIKSKLISDSQEDSWKKDIQTLQRYIEDAKEEESQELLSSGPTIWYELEPYTGIQMYSNYEYVNISFHESSSLRNERHGKIKKKSFNLQNINLSKYSNENKYLDLLKGHLNFDYSKYAQEANIPSRLAKLTLKELVKSEKLFLNNSEILSGEDIRPLKIQEDVAIFQASIKKEEELWILGGVFKLNHEEIHAETATLTTDLSYIIKDETLYPTNLGKLRTHCEYLVGYGNIKIPLDRTQELKDLIKGTIGLEQTLLDSSFDIEKKVIQGLPKLEISINNKDTQIINAKLNFFYEGEMHSPLSAENIKSKSSLNDLFYLKERSYEESIIKEIKDSPFIDNLIHKDYFTFDIDLANLNQFISFTSKHNIEVRTQGYKVKHHSAPTASIKSENDWFEIKGTIRFENEEAVSIPEIIKTKSLDNNFLILKDGSLGVTPKEWIKKVTKISELSVKEENRYKFNKSQSMILNFLLEDIKLDTDNKYKKVIQELRSFKKIKDVTVSKTFNGNLRDYQKSGLNWLSFLYDFKLGGCLADDMGLGKTIQVLAHLQRIKYIKNKPKHKQHLIVVPKSLIHNWKEEAQRFTPNLKVLIYEGTKRSSLIDSFTEYDLIIMTYSVMRKDIKEIKQFTFGYAVLDEAQNIKNTTTLVTKAAYLIQSEYKLALTGTPIENSIKELFSIFRFLIPSLLPKAYANGKIKSNDQSLKAILTGLMPFILRRTKDEVLKDLPSKVESLLYCDFEKEQEKIYKEMKTFYQQSLSKKIKKDDIKKSKIHILEALLRMRQASCHPGLINKDYLDYESSKINVLLKTIRPLIEKNEKVIIFSQFTSFLKIIREQLSKENIDTSYLDGQTTKRDVVIKDFKENSDKSVFLISLKAGGVGLNLTEASYCFIVDPWWNPAAEAQAIDRIHRIGQKKKVFAYRLITQNSIEEKIIKLQESKKKVSNSILTTDESLLKQLSPEDLKFLFS